MKELYLEYVNKVYSDLLPYTFNKKFLVFDHYLHPTDLPSFKNFYENKEFWLRRPIQETFIIDEDGRLRLVGHSGIYEPEGNWLCYRRYNTWQMCPFNSSGYIFNKDLKMKLYYTENGQKIKFGVS